MRMRTKGRGRGGEKDLRKLINESKPQNEQETEHNREHRVWSPVATGTIRQGDCEAFRGV